MAGGPFGAKGGSRAQRAPLVSAHFRRIELLQRKRLVAEQAFGDDGASHNGIKRMFRDEVMAFSGDLFNRCTHTALSPQGDIYVSDGYRNSRVHKYAADGTLEKSWGEPGNARDLRNTGDKPGLFHTVHSVWEHAGRVYVADRENNRIQIFTPDGEYVDMWTGFERPTKLYVGSDNVMYVAELEDRVSIVDLEGNLLGRFGSERSHDPGKFWGPHCIWTDSVGDLYVAEVLEGARLQKFARRK